MASYESYVANAAKNGWGQTDASGGAPFRPGREIGFFGRLDYLCRMPKLPFEPCIPTRGTKVPSGSDWLHEIKHDGYRLIAQRDGKRVRLFTRNGHDWSGRFPLIAEAALRNRSTSFVIDGEAVVLGVDGISDFASTGSFDIPTICTRASWATSAR